MIGRMTGILIVTSWLVAMSWLVRRDLWPVWTAEPAPSPLRADWMAAGGKVELQAGVFRDSGRIGTLWTVFHFRREVVEREDLIILEQLLPQLAGFRVQADSTYTPEGALDSLKVELRVAGHPYPVKLDGERFPKDFAFTLDAGLGPLPAVKIPLTDADMVAEVFNPFTTLPKLHVGQAWKMQVINPVAALTNVGEKFLTLVARVTRREKTATNFGVLDCFVVESEKVRAWVDAEGVVQIQEVHLPVASTIRIIRERFDPDLYNLGVASQREWELDLSAP